MRLWRALENVHGWAGVRSVWLEHMGEELEFLQPLLVPMDTLAMWVPWPGTHEGRRVVIHDEDDIVAIDDETFETASLRREEIVLWKLDADSLFQGISTALGLAGMPASIGMGNRLWWLGDYIPIAGERFPVYLATTHDANELIQNTGYISALSQRPFILATPSRQAASEPLSRIVQGRSSAWIALEEMLDWRGEGIFAARQPLEEALREFIRANIRLATSDRGARFPTPAGATWAEVRIRFLDGHTVSIQVRERSGRFGYADLGMVNAKNNSPTVAWELLRTIADEHGHLTWASRKASADHRKRKQMLSDRLRTFFGIEGDPFEVDGGGWRARFILEPDA